MRIYYLTKDGKRVAEVCEFSGGPCAMYWYENDGQWGGKRSELYANADDCRRSWIGFGVENVEATDD